MSDEGKIRVSEDEMAADRSNLSQGDGIPKATSVQTKLKERHLYMIAMGGKYNRLSNFLGC